MKKLVALILCAALFLSLTAVSGLAEGTPWLERAHEQEKKLDLPKGEDELFAELYEQQTKS